jgi:hypothetical protein
MSHRTTFAGIVAAVCLGIVACGTETSDAERFHQPTADVVFGVEKSSIELEVDYAKGAEPATGVIPGVGADAWSLFATNATRIFAKASPKTLKVPSRLDEMEAIDVAGETFTESEVLAIADRHRSVRSPGASASFYVVWLPGFLADAEGAKPDILGVAIGATGVIAMFKGAIDRTRASGGPGFQAALLEQFTLVHEFGHAVGLVDNGITPASAHRDMSHGPHCSNPACAMYHANEGIAAALTFSRRITAGDEILLGPECLEDIDHFASTH